jgi:hypothetical protein
VTRLRFVLFSLIITLVSSSSASALSPFTRGTTGIDASWPKQNCDLVQKSRPAAAFGIIGVNHGLDFTYNNCLSQEAGTFGNNYSLYLNTGYPGISYSLKYQSYPRHCSEFSNQCLAYNYGYNDAKLSIKYADLNNAHATNWWLDVETDNSWTDNPFVNVSELQGTIAAIKQYTFFSTIGFYSLQDQWFILTGDWDNDYFAWTATGADNKAAAVEACREPSFTGGKLLLAQYTLKLDEDYVC